MRSHRQTFQDEVEDIFCAEVFTEQIELKTGICSGPDEILAELREARRAVAGLGNA